jgi:hypothetical protein
VKIFTSSPLKFKTGACCQNTENKQLLEGAKKIKQLFKGQQCKFPTRFRRIVAVSSIAAVGASDYGVQSVIMGTLKALTDEMGLGLTANELSRGVPDVGSLRNYEFDGKCYLPNHKGR